MHNKGNTLNRTSNVLWLSKLWHSQCYY